LVLVAPDSKYSEKNFNIFYDLFLNPKNIKNSLKKVKIENLVIDSAKKKRY